MADPLECTDIEISTETLERGKYVKLDDGTFAKRVVIVTGGDPLDCDDIEIGTETLIRGTTVRVGPNQYADQIVVTT